MSKDDILDAFDDLESALIDARYHAGRLQSAGISIESVLQALTSVDRAADFARPITPEEREDSANDEGCDRDRDAS
jgi:hypothetical protein